MKNLKKVLALVLACALIFGSVAMVSAKTYPDVKADAAYAPAVSLLSSLKIIEGDDKGNFNPDKNITRAEFAKVMDVALGATGVAQTATAFDDVKSDHWASGFVAYANQLGIIKGYGDGKFGPEDPVTYEQAIKMIVVALGYEPMAQDNGGYPTGYMMVAADLGITKGATGKVGEPANRATVATLLANALDAPIMKRVKFGTDSEYAKMDGTDYDYESILNSKLNAYKIEAKIISNSKTALDKTEAEKAGMVKIEIMDLLDIPEDVIGIKGDKPGNIAAKDSGAENLLGYYAVLYIRELASGDFEIINAAPKTGKNIMTEIADSQAYDPEKDGSVNENDKTDLISEMVYGYWEKSRDTDSRMKALDVDPESYLMFNGVSMGKLSDLTASEKRDYLKLEPVDENDNFTFDDRTCVIKPSVGSIKFVDTENDGYVDIIDVKSYSTGVVDSVSDTAKRINFTQTYKGTGTGTGSMGGSIVLDTYKNSDLKEWTITKDGAAIELKDIKQYDVVNFVTDKFDNPTFYDIIVTSKTIEGTVTEVYDENNDDINDKFYIDGTAYKAIANGPAIDLEDAGVFYLDMRGNIVYSKNKGNESFNNYAVLYRMIDKDLDDYKASIFTQEGSTIDVTIYDKIKINGKTKSGVDDAYYTVKDLKDMFNGLIGNVDLGYAADADADSNIVTLGQVMTAASLGTTDDKYKAADQLSPIIFLQALFGGDTVIGGKDAPVFKSFVKEASVGADGDAKSMKFVTYNKNSDNVLTAIDISLALSDNEDAFNLAEVVPAAEYDSKFVKFDEGKAISENTKVFYLPGSNKTDWQVRGISSLKDGGKYTNAYFFDYNLDDGTGAIVLYSDVTSIGPDAPISVYFKSTNSIVDGEDVTKIYYWQDGKAVAAPIVADQDLETTGMATTLADLRTGDVFVYDLDSEGKVGAMHVLFKPGTTQAKIDGETGYDAAAFEKMMNADSTPGDANNDGVDDDLTGIQEDWKLANNKLNKDADAEIWFGYVYKKSSVSSGTAITLVGTDGKLANAKEFIVPSTAKVIQYNAYTSSESQKLKEATVGDITQSFFSKDTTGGQEKINFAPDKFNKDDMEYAFVRKYNDEVLEVIIVDYAN